MATSIILVCAQGIALAYKRARSSPAKVTRLAPCGFQWVDQAASGPLTSLKN